MQNIIHYSFDLWFTLIKSNPTFKIERSLYFYEKFNTLNITLEEVEAIFREVDLMCNGINEKTGGNIEAEEMYLMVLYRINKSNEIFKDINLKELYVEIESMLFKNPPTLFSADTYSVLEKVKNIHNVTTNILSNTAFIKGNTLRKILSNLEIDKYFDFQIYSDEVNLSKPNHKIFDLLLKEVCTYRNIKTINPLEIIHIGDNIIADINGAASKGISTFQINSNQNTISNIFT